MSKTVIQVSCVDQTLRLTNSPKIASGGVGEDYLQVSFCAAWDGYGKTAVFFRDRQTVYPVPLDENGECEIPSVVLADPGPLYFAVYGTNGDSKRTSEVLEYIIVEGALVGNSVPPEDPAQSVYDQIIALLASKAPLASPALTGTPTAPTAAAGTDTQQIATTAFVAAAIAALVNSAPGTLDTLEELAAALGDDPNFATTITTLIGQKAAASDLTAHIQDAVKHITAAERTAWNGKLDSASLTAHTENTTVHITADERAAWNGKQDNIAAGSTAPDDMAASLTAGDIYIYCPTLPGDAV